MSDDRPIRWDLLAAGLTALGVVVTLFKMFLNAADSRADERFHLMLTNGGGKALKDMMKAATLEALQEHQQTCPHSAHMGSIEERLVTLERAK